MLPRRERRWGPDAVKNAFGARWCTVVARGVVTHGSGPRFINGFMTTRSLNGHGTPHPPVPPNRTSSRRRRVRKVGRGSASLPPRPPRAPDPPVPAGREFGRRTAHAARRTHPLSVRTRARARAARCGARDRGGHRRHRRCRRPDRHRRRTSPGQELTLATQRGAAAWCRRRSRPWCPLRSRHRRHRRPPCWTPACSPTPSPGPRTKHAGWPTTPAPRRRRRGTRQARAERAEAESERRGGQDRGRPAGGRAGPPRRPPRRAGHGPGGRRPTAGSTPGSWVRSSRSCAPPPVPRVHVRPSRRCWASPAAAPPRTTRGAARSTSWSTGRRATGWRPVRSATARSWASATSSGASASTPAAASGRMSDRGGATANHFDHVHVSFKPGAGSGPPSSC